VDVQQCSAVDGAVAPGAPAECDRMALAQIEYRGALGLNVDPFALLGRTPAARSPRGALPWESAPRRSRGRFKSEWVVFFDAGRGWRIGDGPAGLAYGTRQLPPLRTFRSDVGVGLLFGAGPALDQFGVYVAKAVSDANEPANFVVRLRRRF
jgi:hypothetical protein